jgi:hypothetical protein
MLLEMCDSPLLHCDDHRAAKAQPKPEEDNRGIHGIRGKENEMGALFHYEDPANESLT